jgi:hypothetical protein
MAPKRNVTSAVATRVAKKVKVINATLEAINAINKQTTYCEVANKVVEKATRPKIRLSRVRGLAPLLALAPTIISAILAAIPYNKEEE